MNKARQDQVAPVVKKLQECQIILKTIAEEMQAEFDELSDFDQSAPKGYQMWEDINRLNEAVDCVESATSELNP